MKPMKHVTPEQTSRRARLGLWLLLAAALLLVSAASFWLAPHGYFTFDKKPWFYPVFGLGAAMAFIVVSWLLGFVLKRRETYWEER